MRRVAGPPEGGTTNVGRSDRRPPVKALVYHGPGALAFEDVPIPEIAEDEVLVKTGAVGICGSDLHAFQHETPRRVPPIVMGHEVSGIVEAVGSDVRHVQPGDRVVPHPVTHCGSCATCLAGETHLCPDRVVLGVSIPGCYAEHFKVNARVVYKMPDSLSFEISALTEPFSVGLHAAELASAGKPANALIIGAGTIGLMTLIHARRNGIRDVFVEDLSPDRLELARQFTGIIDHDPGSLPPCDVVFDAVGIEPTFQRAVQLTRTGGQVVLLGMSQPTVGLDLLAVVTRELRLRGSYAFSTGDMEKALPALSPDLEALLGLVRPFEEAIQVFEELASCGGKIVKAMLTF